jgi:hypothetical protein
MRFAIVLPEDRSLATTRPFRRIEVEALMAAQERPDNEGMGNRCQDCGTFTPASDERCEPCRVVRRQGRDVRKRERDASDRARAEIKQQRDLEAARIRKRQAAIRQAASERDAAARQAAEVKRQRELEAVRIQELEAERLRELEASRLQAEEEDRRERARPDELELIAAARRIDTERKHQADVAWARRILDDRPDKNHSRRPPIPKSVRHSVWVRLPLRDVMPGEG